MEVPGTESISKHTDMATYPHLTMSGPHRQLCRTMLRHSMAAVIVSVLGYCFFVNCAFLLGGTTSPLSVGPLLILLASTVGLTVLGHPLVSKPDRDFPAAVLLQVRKRAMAGWILGGLGLLITVVFPLAAGLYQRDTTASHYDANGNWVEGDYGPTTAFFYLMLTWVGPLSCVYYGTMVVISVLLYRAAKRALAVVAVPSLVATGADHGFEMQGQACTAQPALHTAPV